MKRKLGELLIEAGAVTAADVESALCDQSAGEPSRLGDLLLSTGRCTPRQLAEALAAQHELPFADLSYVAPEASALIPLEFQRAHKLVPFRVEKDQGVTRIHVALSDPTLSDVVEELRSQLKHEVVVHVAPIDDIENVHLALSGEPSEAGLAIGTVVEAEATPEVSAEVTFPAPLSELSAPAPGAVTAEELFGSMDLEGAPATAPLSTDLADEIGRADAVPAHQEFLGFSALAAPMEPVVDRFGGAPSAPPLQVVPERELTAAPSSPEPAPSVPEEPALDMLEPLIEAEAIPAQLPSQKPAAAVAAQTVGDPLGVVPAPLLSPSLDLSGVSDDTQKFGAPVPQIEPQRIPSFAIPPEVPVEPRRSPVAPRGPATLGRIALKRVAVTREGTPAVVPVIPPPRVAAVASVSDPQPLPQPAAEPGLPEWMRSPPDPAPVIALSGSAVAAVSGSLEAVLARVESGELLSGAALAALFRLLVERGVLDEAWVAAALEKL